MEDCQGKVENVFGSLQNDWIIIRSIMLYKEPKRSLTVFIILNTIGSCCTTGFFRYIVWCILCCAVLLCISLGLVLETKPDAAIQKGGTNVREKRRYEEEMLSYQRFCSILAPVLMFAESHGQEFKKLKKLVENCSASYFSQIDILISLPMASLLVVLTLTGIIHFLAVSLWIVSLCSLWLPWQYYGVHSIICEIARQLFARLRTIHKGLVDSKGKCKAANSEQSKFTTHQYADANDVPKKVSRERTVAPQRRKDLGISSGVVQAPIAFPLLTKKSKGASRRRKTDKTKLTYDYGKHQSLPSTSGKQRDSDKSKPLFDYGSQKRPATTSLSRQTETKTAIPSYNVEFTHFIGEPTYHMTTFPTFPDFKGTVPLPHTYICSDNLMGQCQNHNCPLHHLKKPYQWIYRHGGEWWMVDDDDNDRLERCFCNPNIKKILLSLKLDRLRRSRNIT